MVPTCWLGPRLCCGVLCMDKKLRSKKDNKEDGSWSVQWLMWWQLRVIFNEEVADLNGAGRKQQGLLADSHRATACIWQTLVLPTSSDMCPPILGLSAFPKLYLCSKSTGKRNSVLVKHPCAQNQQLPPRWLDLHICSSQQSAVSVESHLQHNACTLLPFLPVPVL